MNTVLHFATLDEARRRLRDLPSADAHAADQARARQQQLLKPPGALGRLEDLAVWLAAWQRRHPPAIDHAWVLIFAGNHGVTARGVSPYPPTVTRQMVAAFHQGDAAINQICATVGADLEIFPLDLDQPTADATTGPAMDESGLLAAFNIGARAAAREADLLCLGEMGIGNTTAAAALAHALHGGQPAAWVGAGSGADASVRLRKIDAVRAAVALHRSAAADPLDLLRRLGGRELAAIAGAVLGARLAGVPVVLDGYTATIAAAALECQQPGALDHCQIGHLSAEPGHRLVAHRLQRRPLLDLEMRLGEASGAALAIPLLKAACACHAGMATFAEAGVAGPADARERS
jgi:nicotinate-nucleotide--dimethylbenzimidazole phosphoribosyltransferase